MLGWSFLERLFLMSVSESKRHQRRGDATPPPEPASTALREGTGEGVGVGDSEGESVGVGVGVGASASGDASAVGTGDDSAASDGVEAADDDTGSAASATDIGVSVPQPDRDEVTRRDLLPASEFAVTQATIEALAPAGEAGHEAGREAGAGAGTGAAPDPERRRARAHPRASVAAPDVTLAPAMRIGRYSILRELGRGGMGITYVGYDEELERKVAIKLVRPELGGSGESEVRLRREAQALARLAHPNIVSVYEVGHYRGQTYLVMELIEGQSASAWLKQSARTWPEVLEVFVQVGRGLQAAHAAGLIHRDVKPANMILGEDGRVRILDFGLAQLDGEPAEMASSDTLSVSEFETSRSSSGERTALTAFGTTVGTPAYMAPEQIRGEVADARSDQFSFCVSLFEAVYGERPFSGSSMSVLHSEVEREAIPEVIGKSSVPGWLHATIVRGLAPRPKDRWPSMDALLEALKHEPGRARRRWFAIAALAVGVLGLGSAGVAGYLAMESRREALCSGAQAQMDEVWNRDTRAAIERAMDATGVPYAAASWRRTESLLDDYAARWVSAHTDACEATAVREEQSRAVLDQRMHCLAGRRRSLGALAAELQRIDAVSVANAAQAASRLPWIASCANADYLSEQVRPPDSPEVAREVEALQGLLSQAEQLDELGRYGEGLAIAQSALERAIASEYQPILARSHLHVGVLQLREGLYEQAESHLSEAHYIARAAGDHEVALRAAIELVYVVGFRLSRFAEGLTWSRHAEAELPWVGSRVAEALLLQRVGELLTMQGAYEEALARLQRALGLLEDALGREHPSVADAAVTLAMTYHRQGRFAEARARYLRALAIQKQALGEDHPQIARTHNNLGLALREQGRYDEAAAEFERAAAIWRVLFGPVHPSTAAPLNNLGTVRLRQGELGEALNHYQQALGSFEETLAPDHPNLAYPLLGMAVVYLRQNQPARALPLAQRALRVREARGVAAAEIGEARFLVAQALMGQGERSKALALARDARDTLRASDGVSPYVKLDEVEAWLSEHGR
ncbi:serine/threonine protein kinase with TPR repeats [Haliangium ochraceum DSM 14365]|uniref:Serine/threonine protein kinase with TPR repeats n=2 Tax=Haliangium ochraceum TaxID=80816 RepID=D0LKI9_HALO1|nr:serine/threonine protein kinase with TPR repeats [Haliangium ochraceum DSM 14365]